jgi:hypothetical protein
MLLLFNPTEHKTIGIHCNAEHTARGSVSNIAVQTAHVYDVTNKHVTE